MKAQIHEYVFDPVAGTIAFPEFAQVSLDRLLLVTNATFSECLWNLADDGAGLASVSVEQPNVFELTHDMTGMSATDALEIFYDLAPGDPGYDEARTVMLRTDGNITVDLHLDGVDARTDAPGVLTVGLAGPGGELLDVLNGGLRVNDVKGGDRVVGGSDRERVAGQRQAGTFAEYRLTAGAVAVNGPTWDANAFRSVSVQAIAGIITLQGSNDGVNWTTHALTNISSVGASVPAVTVTPGVISAGTLRTRYFRVQLPVAGNCAVTFFSEPMDYSGTPVGSVAALPQGSTSDAFANAVGAITATQTMVFDDPTNQWKLTRGSALGRDSTGVGITATGLMGQLDDVTPTGVTENRFAHLRMTARRALHGVLRDSSGRGGAPGPPISTAASQQYLQTADFGAEVDDRRRLLVDVDPGMFGRDEAILRTAPGVQGVTLVNANGDPLTEQAGGLAVVDVTPLRARVPFTSFGTVALRALPNPLILAVVVTNVNAALRYFQLFGDANVQDGQLPLWSWPIPAGSATAPGSVSLGAEFFGDEGTPVGAWGISTDIDSFVAATPADHTVNGACR